jgi:long-chain acyl-CoA synthetase
MLNEVINVGGLKFLAREVEIVASGYEGIELVKVVIAENIITGHHLELLIQVDNQTFNLDAYRLFLSENLQRHMIPRRINIESVPLNHRFKKG